MRSNYKYYWVVSEKICICFGLFKACFIRPYKILFICFQYKVVCFTLKKINEDWRATGFLTWFDNLKGYDCHFGTLGDFLPCLSLQN